VKAEWFCSTGRVSLRECEPTGGRATVREFEAAHGNPSVIATFYSCHNFLIYVLIYC